MYILSTTCDIDTLISGEVTIKVNTEIDLQITKNVNNTHSKELLKSAVNLCPKHKEAKTKRTSKIQHFNLNEKRYGHNVESK